MADSSTPTTSTSLPPLPVSAGAPGQQPYTNDNGTAPGQGNGNQGNPSHMPPPPLAPVIIPQNTNPIPTAITSPLSGGSGVMSPTSAGGFVRRAAPEPNKRALYVGGLDPRVTEDVLRQIFETTGHVQNVKIIPDKNVGAVSIKPFSIYPWNHPLFRKSSPVALLATVWCCQYPLMPWLQSLYIYTR
jgi:nucleolysin TIA-1/TIAR